MNGETNLMTLDLDKANEKKEIKNEMNLSLNRINEEE